jgi:hypothetical protein
MKQISLTYCYCFLKSLRTSKIFLSHVRETLRFSRNESCKYCKGLLLWNFSPILASVLTSIRINVNKINSLTYWKYHQLGSQHRAKGHQRESYQTATVGETFLGSSPHHFPLKILPYRTDCSISAPPPPCPAPPRPLKECAAQVKQVSHCLCLSGSVV